MLSLVFALLTFWASFGQLRLYLHSRSYFDKKTPVFPDSSGTIYLCKFSHIHFLDKDTGLNLIFIKFSTYAEDFLVIKFEGFFKTLMNPTARHRNVKSEGDFALSLGDFIFNFGVPFSA